LREGTDEDVPVGEAPEGSDATPVDAAGDEAEDNEQVGEN
jgi:hypothetical protein